MCYHSPEVIAMKLIQTLTDERFARPAARFMEAACYVSIAFLALCTVMSCMGRQDFFLHTSTELYEHAIFAEEDHDPHSRGMTVHMGDEIRVWTGDGDRLDPAVHVGLSLMYAVHTIPLMLAFWCLSRVFASIHRGEIFTDKNASCLLFYGLLQFFVAVFVPLLKMLISWVTTLVSDNRVTVSTGQDLFNTLIPSIAYIVAAYIIHYGVHLQDEVDHTL